jgi:hypothetical protein
VVSQTAATLPPSGAGLAVSTVPPTNVRPSPSRKPLYLVGGALLVASVIATIAIVASSSGGGKKKDAPPKSEPKHEQASLPDPKPQEPTAAEICARGCALIEKCGSVVDPNCQSNCVNDDVAVACARNATTCDQAAACVISAVCDGVGPTGNASCNATAECEFRCSFGDGACACRCTHAMAPDHAIAIFLLNQCAIACGGNMQCIQQSCVQQAQRCLSQ